MNNTPLPSHKKNRLLAFLTAIRVHQYAKNTLVFVPVLTGQLYANHESLIQSSIAFLAFCLIASSVYLINDLSDLEVDRQHRTKCNRPLAAKDISVPLALVTIFLFTVIAFYLATQLSRPFIMILFSYFTLTQLYTFYFKKTYLIDVIMLALFYVLRVIAGIAAIASDYSWWLILFTFFFFLSLAFTKRYTEVYFTKKDNKTHILGRGYCINDLHQLSIFGIISGSLSIAVFSTYIFSKNAQLLYHHKIWLWFIDILLCSWLIRLWKLSLQGKMSEDPVAFALQDSISVSILVAITWMLFMAI